MVGAKKNLAPMWAGIRPKLDLEPPVPLHGNVYLGSGQEDTPVPEKLLKEKQELYQRLLGEGGSPLREPCQ